MGKYEVNVSIEGIEDADDGTVVSAEKLLKETGSWGK